MNEVKHHPGCTWERHVAAGEKPPGETFWGKLNYGWCQSFCERDLKEVDFTTAYKMAYGENYSLIFRAFSFTFKKTGWKWVGNKLKHWSTGGTWMNAYEHRRYNRNRGIYV